VLFNGENDLGLEQLMENDKKVIEDAERENN
jgi:hypothetical protein